MNSPETYFNQCLYFNATNLARIITRLAEQEFKITGLSPSHAFTLMLVNATPGICPKELASKLHLAPSTVTRFIDYLEHKKLLQRQFDGKNAQILPTDSGKKLQKKLQSAWKNLYFTYSKILGQEEGTDLACRMRKTRETLESKAF